MDQSEYEMLKGTRHIGSGMVKNSNEWNRRDLILYLINSQIKIAYKENTENVIEVGIRSRRGA